MRSWKTRRQNTSEKRRSHAPMHLLFKVIQEWRIDAARREIAFMMPLTEPKRLELIRSPRFVGAFPKPGYRAIRLRAYKLENPPATEHYSDCTIWEAARATAAAPFYFPTAKIRGKKFRDGGLSYNNPVSEVLREGTDLFGEHSVSWSSVSVPVSVRPISNRKS